MESYISERDKQKNRKNKIMNHDQEYSFGTERHVIQKKNISKKEINDDQIVLAEKTKKRLKSKITEWMNYDDRIRMLNTKVKKYKDLKKKHEEKIIDMITKLGLEDAKIDVHDDNNNLRGRVYRYKSSTKGPLKEKVIKDALMEAIRDENKVIQLIKKINDKRPINERYYLKRTKCEKN
jgi:hypothetical protein